MSHLVQLLQPLDRGHQLRELQVDLGRIFEFEADQSAGDIIGTEEVELADGLHPVDMPLGRCCCGGVLTPAGLLLVERQVAGGELVGKDKEQARGTFLLVPIDC